MLADAAYIVTDAIGRVAMFLGNISGALLYAAKVHGVMDGPMSAKRAKELVDAAAKALYQSDSPKE